MLTQIELENFKCFKERTLFPLGKITLLTGVNGCGKSTLLQSLLLMRQSIDHNENTVQILLNGSCINLNSFQDIRNTSRTRNDQIIFKYYFVNEVIFKFNGSVEYGLNENLDDDMVAQITKIEFSGRREITQEYQQVNDKSYYDIYMSFKYNKYELLENLQKYGCTYKGLSIDEEKQEVKLEGTSFVTNNLIPVTELGIWDGWDSSLLYETLNFSHIHYISADRLGPQEFYLKSTLGKFPNVGAKGQFTVNLLYKKRDSLVNDRLCLGQDAKTLYTQTEEWLNQILNGAKVEIPSSDSNILNLLFNTSTSKDRFKPANVGFGYHCVLPIIVSGLIAKEGEILIVENPEAHLHPRAQSQLARFLAKVSSCGVQVFIESHSEHILNALRIAVLDDIIIPENLSILYFQQNQEKPFVKIPIQADGGIEEWPEGFFDQMDHDFSRLFGM
jgi:predicted ATPase